MRCTWDKALSLLRDLIEDEPEKDSFEAISNSEDIVEGLNRMV